MSISTLAKMPGFDIYIADLYVKNGLLQLEKVQPVTQTNSYDNQPIFLPDGDSLFYTTALMADESEQTDSVWLSLKTGKSINLTQSVLSEYSPTLTPDGRSFSVIRVENGQQKLWRYPLTPKDPEAKPASELLQHVEPVGYHTWVDNDRVLLFVLGEPHSLQLASISKQSSKLLDKNIGPSLYTIPHTHMLSYTKGSGEGESSIWQLKSLEPNSGQSKVLTSLPKGAYYYGWSGDGKAITAVASELLQWDPARPSMGWQIFADMTKVCPKGVTRLTTNQQNSKLAFVCTL